MRDVRDPWFWARTPTGYDSNVCLEYLIILYFTYLVTYLNNFLILLANLFTLLFSILEISKSMMYQLYYDYLKPKYGDKCTLLFTDTDSFCSRIQTEDLCQDMSQNLDLLDTSLNVYSRIQYCVKSMI